MNKFTNIVIPLYFYFTIVKYILHSNIFRNFKFLAQVENSIARENPKYNQPGRASATQVEVLCNKLLLLMIEI
jgi:hypothetical protein